MSYAVVRMQKMKSHDLKGMQFHNQRERESKTNSDIDKSKTHENYDLVNSENIDYNERVKDIIESQKTGTRKTRKDAVLVNELLITSDKNFFERLDPVEQKRFFEESYKLFAERYGIQNIAYATVHNDEKTPHLHLGVVPMRDGKLQGKNVFNRQELLWLQDEFPKHMQELGFDLQRGEKGSGRKHIETQEFKKQTLKKDIDSLEKDLKAKKNELLALNENVPDDVKVPHKKQLRNVEVPTGEKTFLGKPKTKTEKKLTGNVILRNEDYEKLKGAASDNKRLKGEIKKLLNTDLTKENKELKAILEQEQKDFSRVVGEYNKLYEKKEDLKSENLALKQKNTDLKQEIKMLYESTKEFLKERTNDFKGVFKGFIDKVRGKAPKGEFERLYDAEERKNRTNKFSLDGLKNLDQEVRQQKKKNKNRGWEMER